MPNGVLFVGVGYHPAARVALPGVLLVNTRRLDQIPCLRSAL
jgi:hypothetical protein